MLPPQSAYGHKLVQLAKFQIRVQLSFGCSSLLCSGSGSGLRLSFSGQSESPRLRGSLCANTGARLRRKGVSESVPGVSLCQAALCFRTPVVVEGSEPLELEATLGIRSVRVLWLQPF